MLVRFTVERHHIFPLDTAASHSAKVKAPRIRRFTMAARTQASTVAVVDDDQSVLQSIECLLESADYAVRLFTSAAGLLDSGCLPEIGCLISDIDMPGTDGVELIRLVRATHPRLPIILITGYPERLASLPPVGGSSQRHFTKPFQGHELLEAVSAALRSSSLPRP